MPQVATRLRRGRPKARDRRKPRQGYAGSLLDLAEACGVSTGALYQWRARGCPIRQEPAGYRIEPVRKWVDEHMAGPGPERTGSDSARLLRAQADERESKAALAELQLKVQRGELVPLEEIKERDVRRIAAVRRGLLSLPKALGALVAGLSPPEAEALLDRKVRDLLERFASL